MKIPKEIDTGEIIRKDTEKFIRMHKDIMDRLAGDKADDLEKFLYSWALIEKIFLPSLMRYIFHKLSLRTIPDLEKISVSQLINHYYFISHDVDLYKKLIKGNNLRNKIVHEMCDTDPANLKEELKENCSFVSKEIIAPILERLNGETPTPVLTLYSKGWNDYRKETIKILERMKEKI